MSHEPETDADMQRVYKRAALPAEPDIMASIEHVTLEDVERAQALLDQATDSSIE